MSIRKIILPLLTLSILSGCMNQVRTIKTTFYAPNHNQRGTIFVVASDNKLNNSLEFKHYQAKFNHKLNAEGYSIANSAEESEFIALVSYGIDNGKSSIVSTPIFGQTGGGTTYSSGTVYGYSGSASYSGSSYTMPTYGIVGSSTSSVIIYIRAIAMDILRTKSLKSENPVKMYEIRAKSSGSCSVIVEVFDEILEAMFEKFPGESGKAITVDVKAEENC